MPGIGFSVGPFTGGINFNFAAFGLRGMYRRASFRGATFHVDVGSKISGRRVALHEFPKRDIPWAEDMGRRAKRFQITAYVIGDNYVSERDALINACEREGPGMFVHPTLGETQVVCELYNVTEEREKGRLATFQLNFVEYGTPPDMSGAASSSASTQAAGAADSAASRAVEENNAARAAAEDQEKYR